MKVNELTGAALDWAVAKCEGLSVVKVHELKEGTGCPQEQLLFVGNPYYLWRPSTDWSQGGPIIEREKIKIAYDHEVVFYPTYIEDNGELWYAELYTEYITYVMYGPTPLITAMRCYVSAKLGYDVEMPKALQDLTASYNEK